MKAKAIMVIALLCTFVQGALADNAGVTYIERSWDVENKTVTSQFRTVYNYTVLSGSHPDDWIGLGDIDNTVHYYVVEGDVSYKVAKIFGTVRLILTDGSTLSLSGGLKLERENRARLHIYSQSYGDNQGTLNSVKVKGVYSFAPAIGVDNDDQVMGCLYIYGGNIIADSRAAQASGIGGSKYCKIEEVAIYGGTVTARGGRYGAGIGGCEDDDMGGQVNIYGGTVYAYGGRFSAGIGTGSFGNNALTHPGTINIHGGHVEAYGYGCFETDTDNKTGAGIGGGYNGCGGDVHIHGGEVYARGGCMSSGIGGSCDDEKIANGGTLEVTGGYVFASSSVSSNEKYRDKYCAPGIGGGYAGKGGKVTITGGVVEALTRRTTKVPSMFDSPIPEGNKYAPIGGGLDKSSGTLTLGDMMKVSTSNHNDAISNETYRTGKYLTCQPSAARVDACQSKDNTYARIEACTEHKDFVYTIADEVYHTKHCRYCEYSYQEEHYKTYCDCGKFSYSYFTVYHPGTQKDTYEEGETSIIGADHEFYLPDCTTEPEGYKFLGWAMNPDPDDNKWEAMLGEDIKAPGDTVMCRFGQGEAKFYPRYLFDIKDEWTWYDDYSWVMLTLSCPAFDYDLHYTSDKYVTISEETRDGERYYIATYTYKDKNSGYEYLFTSVQKVAARVLLRNFEDNSAVLSDYNDKFVGSVMLKGRDLYIDGSWNTLCLPFEVSGDKVASMLENPSALKKLKSSSFENGVLTLNFVDASYISAGVPYLIKWDVTGPTIGNPAFDDVIIYNTSETTTSTDYVDFVGSFSPVNLEANDRSVLYIGAGNKLYYPSADMTIGSCRGYFRLNGLTAGDKAGVRSFVLNFGDETTGVGHTEITEITEKGEAWYTLDGRKLSGKPAQRGVYINNGKKIIIK